MNGQLKLIINVNLISSIYSEPFFHNSGFNDSAKQGGFSVEESKVQMCFIVWPANGCCAHHFLAKVFLQFFPLFLLWHLFCKFLIHFVLSSKINVTYSQQLSTVYLFGKIRLRITRKWIENHLYMTLSVVNFTGC